MVRRPDFQNLSAVLARRKSLFWDFFEKNIPFLDAKTGKAGKIRSHHNRHPASKLSTLNLFLGWLVKEPDLVRIRLPHEIPRIIQLKAGWVSAGKQMAGRKEILGKRV